MIKSLDFRLSLVSVSLMAALLAKVVVGHVALADASVPAAVAVDDGIDVGVGTKPQADTERISVTANRRENVDTDLAMAVESISGKTLDLDNGQHVAESLNSVAGVLINQIQGSQGHNAAIRMPINYSGYYLYLQDNIPLQSPAFFNHNGLWWASFNSDVGRIEVIKGAGTALYGSGAVAATINLLSQPNAKKPTSELSLDSGENGYGKLAFSHSGPIDADQSFRVSGSYLTNDGWREHTGSKRGEISIRHQYRLDDKQQVQSSLIYSNLDQQMAANLREADFLTDRTSSGLSAEVLAIDPTRKSQYLRISSSYTNDVDDQLHWSVIPYYRHLTNEYTATWNVNMPKVVSSVNSLGLLALADWLHKDNSLTSFGIDIEVSEGDQLSYQPLTVVTTGRGADTFLVGETFYDDSTRYIGISPYVQHQREITEDLDLTLGLRYDTADYRFDNALAVVGDIGHGTQSLADRSDDFSHLSPKASLNYHLNDDSSVYLRYANSFRIPSVGSLYHLKTSDSSTSIGGIDPETSDTYEIGYKANLATVSFDIAAYYMAVDDAIVNAYDNNGVRYQANAGEVSHRGFEFSSHWQINPSYGLNFSYTRATHKFDQFVIDAGRVDGNGNSRAQDLAGNTMRMAPKYIANIRFNLHPQSLTALTAQFEVQSIGDYWMDDQNTREYDGYTVANVKLRYQLTRQLSVNAKVINLTDKYYAQEAEISFGQAKMAPAAPRSVYLSAQYQW